MSQDVKNIFDAAALATTMSTLFGWLPPLAAAVSIIYTGFRIWETDTVKGWVARRDAPESGPTQKKDL